MIQVGSKVRMIGEGRDDEEFIEPDGFSIYQERVTPDGAVGKVIFIEPDTLDGLMLRVEFDNGAVLGLLPGEFVEI